MNFDMKLQTVKDDNLKMAMSSTINMLGQNVDMKMYYADGYYYIDVYKRQIYPLVPVLAPPTVRISPRCI